MKTLCEVDEELGIKKPKILKLNNYNAIGSNSYNQLLNSIDTLPFNKEGYMLYSKNRKYRVKIKGSEHLKVHKIKGNYPNILQRLLEIRECIKKDNNVEFLEYFSEYTDDMLKLEEKIDNLAKKIYKYYCDVKKLNLNIEIPKLYQKIIIELHNEYHSLMDRYKPEIHTYKPNITLKKVIHFLENNIEKSYFVALLDSIDA